LAIKIKVARHSDYTNSVLYLQVEFKFDFETPRHCSSNMSIYSCDPDSSILTVVEEFTRVGHTPY